MSFWSKMERLPNGCLVWTGAKGRFGYGTVRWKKKMWKAHRLAWTFRNGPIPPGKLILHACDNPPCCEDSHLRPGTYAENMQDASLRLRTTRGERSGTARLKEAEVLEIRSAAARGETQKAIAARYGMFQTTISAIITGKTWKHV